MNALKLLFYYQCTICFKSSLELESREETPGNENYDNVVSLQPQGILERGLSNPWNLIYAYKTFLNEMETDDDDSPSALEGNTIARDNTMDIKQKRLGYEPNIYNEVDHNLVQENALPESTSFNAVRSFGLMFGRLPFQPKVYVEVKADDPYGGEQLSYSTVILQRPNLDIMSAIFSAALQHYLIHPTDSNPFNIMIDYNPRRGCDMIASALDIPNMGVHAWKVRVTRRRGKVIYDSDCLIPKRRNIRMRHGTRVTVYYS